MNQIKNNSGIDEQSLNANYEEREVDNPDKNQIIHKSVTVAIIGVPNVGKSTLLNRIIGSKNSIVSPTAHTTRGCILGVANRDDTQILFIDTPGHIRSGSSIWAEHFISSIEQAVKEADVVLILLDPDSFNTNKSKKMFQKMLGIKNLLVAINKVDSKSRATFYEMIAEIVQLGYNEPVFLISAKDGIGIAELEKEILCRAKEEEWSFENNEDVKLSKEEYVAQCVREKAFYCLKEEIPFGLWTITTKANVNKKPWNAYIDIVVAKKSHKGIVIGKNGQQIKQIGESARTELQTLWGEGQLFLNVVVDEKSLQNPDFVGYICNNSDESNRGKQSKLNVVENDRNEFGQDQNDGLGGAGTQKGEK